MISIVSHKEKPRALKNSVIGFDGIAPNPVGTVIEYHQGDWSDWIGLTPVGKMAMDMYRSGRVRLFQTPMPNGMHSYVVVTR